MKQKNKTNKKKPLYKKWWFWVIVMVIAMSTIDLNGDNSSEKPNPSTLETKTANTDVSPTTLPKTDKEETEKSVSQTQMEIIGRAMMNTFVSKSLCEDWHMLALSFENFEADENGNGKIEMLYLPDNAGNGETKVNMTVEKQGDLCQITYIMTEGINEIDVTSLPDNIRYLKY